MDFAAERKKRRDEAEQRASEARAVAALAGNQAAEIMRALNDDLNRDRSESIQLSKQERTVILRRGSERFTITVTNEMKYALKFVFDKGIRLGEPPEDREDFAHNESELAAKVDRWRGLHD